MDKKPGFFRKRKIKQLEDRKKRIDELSSEPNNQLAKKVCWFENKYGPYIEKRGKENFKNLLRMPNLQEGLILFMIIMVLLMAFVWSIDVDNSFKNGYNTCKYDMGIVSYDYGVLGLENFTLKEDNDVTG